MTSRADAEVKRLISELSTARDEAEAIALYQQGLPYIRGNKRRNRAFHNAFALAVQRIHDTERAAGPLGLGVIQEVKERAAELFHNVVPRGPKTCVQDGRARCARASNPGNRPSGFSISICEACFDDDDRQNSRFPGIPTAPVPRAQESAAAATRGLLEYEATKRDWEASTGGNFDTDITAGQQQWLIEQRRREGGSA